MPFTTRRTFLTHTVLGGAAASLATRPHAAHAIPLKTLKLWGPPATPSVTLVNAVASGGLERVAETPTFRSWNGFDALRAGLKSGRSLRWCRPLWPLGCITRELPSGWPAS